MENLKCTSCNQKFGNKDSAMEHVAEIHNDIVQDNLDTYLPDAVDDAYQELIKEI